MKKPLFLLFILAIALAPRSAQAQADRSTLEALKQQIQQLNQRMQQMQQMIQLLEEKIKQLEEAKAVAPAAEPAMKEQVQQLTEKVDRVTAAQRKVLPGEFNPAIGLVGETVLSHRSQSAAATGSDRPGGFDIFQRSVEMNLAASIDPFLKGYAVINAQADPVTGEATASVEEAALQTTSLPWNLGLTAGRFFAEFGRLADIHDHELPFVNRPLALDAYIGGESKTDGLQVNWLAPVNHYVSLTMGVGDQFGDNPNNPGSFRAFRELNFWGRLSTYFDLTPDWQLETGASGLLNPKTQDRGGVLIQPNGSTLTERERRLAGADLKITYSPLRNNQFRSFTWGTEVLFSDNRYLIDPDGSLNPGRPSPGLDGDEFLGNVGSLGLYSYTVYKLSRQWSLGLTFDWVESAQNKHDRTTACSPFVSWAISHWNQLRLQYTRTWHNAVSGLRDDNAIYLQWAWIIGSHAHGWQQR
ncbi:MAG TPA: hypothetical protein VMS75_02420 [Terriglobales bacterium]|nr:hypothetical protein [Terriglobales bacterium]